MGRETPDASRKVHTRIDKTPRRIKKSCHDIRIRLGIAKMAHRFSLSGISPCCVLRDGIDSAHMIIVGGSRS